MSAERMDKKLTARAFEIADSTMLEQLRAHCVLTERAGGEASLRPCGADGNTVQRVDQAENAVREAFTWLYDRGIARISADGNGYQVIVLRESTKGGS
jgi:hypothetical protein